MTREEFINWFEERFALTKNDIYEFGQLYDEATKPHWISVDGYPLKNNITHWMHLPQLPKKGGEE